MNNTGCENGKGFTTGQGHLNGNSAVDCVLEDPCLEEAIDQVTARIQNDLGGIIISTTITGSNTFLIFWNSGRDGRSCIETTAEATGDLDTGCGYTNLHHQGVPCS